MEHIKLSDEEKQRLIEMLESNNTEDHVLAYGIIQQLNETIKNNILDKLNFYGFVSYWKVSRNNILDYLSK